MSRSSNTRTVQKALPAMVGAAAVTQLPGICLLIAQGSPSLLGGVLYGLASLTAAATAAWFAFQGYVRIERLASIVRIYAESGRLPRPLESGKESASVEQVHASLASLDRLVRNLELDAARDPLTGVLNRRTCVTRLESDLARAKRGKVPFSVVIFDLDNLKALNDEQGHAAGDQGLRHLARQLQAGTREGDWVARWGGDEFVLGLWDATGDDAEMIARRMIEQISDESAGPGLMGALGCSAGVAQAEAEDDGGKLFARADAALLEAKRLGRGRVRLA